MPFSERFSAVSVELGKHSKHESQTMLVCTVQDTIQRVQVERHLQPGNCEQ